MTPLPKYLLGALAVLVGGFLLWFFSDVVFYILIAAVLAIVGEPLVRLMRRVRIRGWQLPEWAAALVALAAIWALMVAFIALFVPLVSQQLAGFAALDMEQLVQSFAGPLAVFQQFLERTFSIHESDFSIVGTLTAQVDAILDFGRLNAFFASALGQVGSLVVALFSVSFITFFFLKDNGLFLRMVVAVFPSRYEANIRHAVGSITRLLIRYFTGLLIESTIMMLLIACALMLWGMSASNAFFIGLLMGVLNVIPYIGPLIGAALSIVVGILDPVAGMSAGQMALVIGGTIAVLKGLDDFVLQPTLYSESVKAHPLEIFLVILLAGSAAGVLGMLLAIPTYNVLRVFAKEFFNNYKLVQKLTEKI